MNKLEAAEEMYRAATAQDEQVSAAWYNLADLLDENGRIHDAIESYRAALAACPTYADAHFNLALCYEKVGEKQHADSHWSRSLKLDSSSEWADTARMHLHGGSEYKA